MKTVIIAHRGASQFAPENTLPAFQLAIEQNVDGIEGDFHLTKDGQIVCIHDRNTARVAKENKIIRDSTLAQLQQLDVGLWWHYNFQGITIPTLTQIWQILPANKKLFMEIKCGVEIVPILVATLHQLQVNYSQLVIISFDVDVLKQLKNMNPQIKILLLATKELYPSIEDILTQIRIIKADGVSMSINPQLDFTLVNQIKKYGYEFHVWTVDDLNLFPYLKKLNINSITTNFPHHFVNLEQNIIPI